MVDPVGSTGVAAGCHPGGRADSSIDTGLVLAGGDFVYIDPVEIQLHSMGWSLIGRPLVGAHSKGAGRYFDHSALLAEDLLQYTHRDHIAQTGQVAIRDFEAKRVNAGFRGDKGGLDCR